MTTQLARWSTSKLVQLGIVPQDKKSLTQYGLELLLTSLEGVALLISVSILSGHPWLWIPFLIGFAPLRTNAGGYHARSRRSCLIISTILYSICLLLAVTWHPHNAFPIAAAILSLIIVILLAPVEAPNKQLSPKLKRRNQRRSYFIVSLEFVFSIVVFIFHISFSAINIFYLGILAASISLIAAKIIHKGRRK